MKNKVKYIVAIVALLFIIISIMNYFGLSTFSCQSTLSCMPEIFGVTMSVAIDWIIKLISIVVISTTMKKENYWLIWITSSIFAPLPTIFLWIIYCYYGQQLLKPVGVKTFNIISLLLACCFIILMLVHYTNFMFTEDEYNNEIINSSLSAIITFVWQSLLAVFVVIQLKNVHKLMILFAILTLLFGYSGLMVLVLYNVINSSSKISIPFKYRGSKISDKE